MLQHRLLHYIRYDVNYDRKSGKLQLESQTRPSPSSLQTIERLLLQTANEILHRDRSRLEKVAQVIEMLSGDFICSTILYFEFHKMIERMKCSNIKLVNNRTLCQIEMSNVFSRSNE